MRTQVIYLREGLTAKNLVINPIAQNSCKMFGPVLRGLVDCFRAGLNKSASEAFHTPSVDAQFHADTAIDSITLHCSGGVASEERKPSTKGDEVVNIGLTLRSSS